MQKLLPILLLLLFYRNVNAQATRDTMIKHSPIKTLTDQQYNALLKGDDLYNMTLPAELNHYPSPDKVLKFKKELDLSPIQVNQLSAITKELHRKVLEMGLIIIKNERTLDSLFKRNLMDNGSLIFYANRYGLYEGELRNALLQACLVTRQLLTPQQITKLESLQNIGWLEPRCKRQESRDKNQETRITRQ